MTGHLHKIRTDERGMSLIVVGMGTFAFMAATMLTVDVGMLMTASNRMDAIPAAWRPRAMICNGSSQSRGSV